MIAFFPVFSGSLFIFGMQPHASKPGNISSTCPVERLPQPKEQESTLGIWIAAVNDQAKQNTASAAFNIL